MLKYLPEASIDHVRTAAFGHYLNNPLIWAARRGIDLADYQKNVLVECTNPSRPVNRVSLRAPRGTGKSFVAAVLFWWFVDVHESLRNDWKCLTTAPIHSQLKDGLWPQFHQLGYDIGLNSDKLLDMRFKGETGLATSRTPSKNRAGTIEGLHADNMLIIIDEAKEVDNDVFDSIEGSLSQAGVDDNRAIIFAVSTPGPKSGYFYDIHQNRFSSWTPIHVRIDEAIESGRISEGWVSEMAEMWGTESVQYQHHVLAEFAEDSDQVFVTINQLNLCFQRHDFLMKTHRKEIMEGSLVIGLDPAGEGSDSTAAAFYNPEFNIIWDIKTESKTRSQTKLGRFFASKWPHADLHIDSIGEGSGTESAAREVERTGRLLRFKSTKKSGWSTKQGSRTRNCRAAAYMRLYELITDPDKPLALPRNNKLVEEIQAHTSIVMANDIIDIGSKNSVKNIIGRSPDLSDAVSMAVFKSSNRKKLKAKSWDYKLDGLT